MAAQIDDDVPPSVTLVATCRTVGCPTNGISCVGTYYANSEAPIYRGLCMECGQPITDLVPFRPAT
jgi:hypothetical protein